MGARQLITSLTQGTPNANIMNARYAHVRDDLLRSHNWNFAQRWSSLATTGTSPTAEFEYEFQLPTDLIRIIKVADNDGGYGNLPYDIYNDKLYCDSNTVYLKYVSKVADPNLMPADFREALAWSLAFDAALAITDSNNARTTAEGAMRRQIARAKSVDSQENYPDHMPVGSWTTSRFGSDSGTWGQGST